MKRILVGNDVVDLSDPRCVGKSESQRFLRRILTEHERGRVAGSDDPDRTLWLLWAAKEAAYKVVSKDLGAPPPFEHAAFAVDLDGLEAPGAGASGTVAYGGRRVPFVAESTTGFIHAVAWWDTDDGARRRAARRVPGGRPDGDARGDLPLSVRWTVRAAADLLPGGAAFDLERLRREAFSDRERGAIHSAPSAAVRLGARRELAERMGVSQRSVEIVCAGGSVGRTPPRLLVDGRTTGADVSLSHHGSLVAWAGWVEPGAASGSA